MSLIGHRVISLDQKGRAVMPASFRAVLPQDLLICQAFQEDGLVIFTEEAFEQYAERSKELMNNDYYAVWHRITYDTLTKIRIDDRGHFLLPKALTEIISFEKEIYMYGHGQCLALYPEEFKIEDNPECVLV